MMQSVSDFLPPPEVPGTGGTSSLLDMPMIPGMVLRLERLFSLAGGAPLELPPAPTPSTISAELGVCSLEAEELWAFEARDPFFLPPPLLPWPVVLFGPTDILAERGDIGGETIASVFTPNVRRRVMARLSPCSAALVNH